MTASWATFAPGWGVSRGTMATEKHSTVVLIWSYICKKKTCFHKNCLSNVPANYCWVEIVCCWCFCCSVRAVLHKCQAVVSSVVPLRKLFCCFPLHCFRIRLIRVRTWQERGQSPQSLLRRRLANAGPDRNPHWKTLELHA